MIFDALFFRQFRRNALLSLVTLTAIALAVAVLSAIELANAAAVGAFDAAGARLNERVNVQIVGSGAPFSERTIGKINALAGVESVLPITDDVMVLEDATGTKEVVHVCGVDLLARLPGDAEWRLERAGAFSPAGSPPAPGALLGGATISQRLATRFHLSIDRPLVASIGGRRVRLPIAGIIVDGRTRIDSSTVFVDIATAQTLFGKIGKLDRIDLIVDPHLLAATIVRLAGLVPPGTEAIEAQDRAATMRSLRDAFSRDVRGLAFIALLVAALLVTNAGAIGVVQRRPEIGTLRALGASRGQIFRTFVAEGAIFGAFGSLFGVIAGASLAGTAARLFGVVSNVHADPFVLLQAWGTGVALAVIAAAVPAIAAARTPPALAMRSNGLERASAGWDRPLAVGGVILACVALALALTHSVFLGSIAAFALIAAVSVCVPFGIALLSRVFTRASGRASAEARLAAANLGSVPGRIGIAVGSLTIAIALSASVAIVIASFQSTMTAWANATLRSDFVLRAAPGTQLPAALLARLHRLSGVLEIDSKRSFDLPYRGSVVRVDALDYRANADAIRVIVGGAPVLLRRRGEAIVSERFAARYDTRVGSSLRLHTPRGEVDVRVGAIATDYESPIGVITLDLTTDTRLFGAHAPTSAAVRLAPGADTVAVRTQLARAAGSDPMQIEATGELRSNVVKLFSGTFAVAAALGVVAIVIAILGVSSTLYALVAERRVEIGLLRVLGLRAQSVRRMVLYEAALIGSFGAILGIALGLVLALVVLFAIDRPLLGWTVELHVPFAILALVASVVIVAALVEGAYPAHVAARILIRDAVRAE